MCVCVSYCSFSFSVGQRLCLITEQLVNMHLSTSMTISVTCCFHILIFLLVTEVMEACVKSNTSPYFNNYILCKHYKCFSFVIIHGVASATYRFIAPGTVRTLEQTGTTVLCWLTHAFHRIALSCNEYRVTINAIFLKTLKISLEWNGNYVFL